MHKVGKDMREIGVLRLWRSIGGGIGSERTLQCYVN